MNTVTQTKPHIGLTFHTLCDRADKLLEPDIKQLLMLQRQHFKSTPPFKTGKDLSKLYVYRVFNNNKLIATRQIQIVTNPADTDLLDWTKKLSQILELTTFAIGSRAVVDSSFRNLGIGTALIKTVNSDIYKKHKLETILGNTTSLRALSLYHRLGAGIFRYDIENMPVSAPLNGKSGLLQQILSTPIIQRLPLGHAISYAYHTNAVSSTYLKHLLYKQLSSNNNFGYRKIYGNFRNPSGCDLAYQYRQHFKIELNLQP